MFFSIKINRSNHYIFADYGDSRRSKRLSDIGCRNLYYRQSISKIVPRRICSGACPRFRLRLRCSSIFRQLFRVHNVHSIRRQEIDLSYENSFEVIRTCASPQPVTKTVTNFSHGFFHCMVERKVSLESDPVLTSDETLLSITHSTIL